MNHLGGEGFVSFIYFFASAKTNGYTNGPDAVAKTQQSQFIFCETLLWSSSRQQQSQETFFYISFILIHHIRDVSQMLRQVQFKNRITDGTPKQTQQTTQLDVSHGDPAIGQPSGLHTLIRHQHKHRELQN